jgi:2-keto-4-pentenoate hydratase/2-oxohepta-3-ene-1,7-dioic acid hydratase in catechol pathway
MKLRRTYTDCNAVVEVLGGRGWIALDNVLPRLSPKIEPADAVRWSSDVVAFLAAPSSVRAEVETIALGLAPDASPGARALLPFEPRSYRDFMLYERHAVDAARGFVRAFRPRLLPLVRAYERLTGNPFPPFRPKPLWYRQPIYYMGNHLAFVTEGDAIAVPSYTRALDFELEIGFVLAHGLLDASPTEAEAAIGGFVVLNDFSARDVQYSEMQSGFGPQKAKHFRNAISSTVVTADAVLPFWKSLKGFVRINGKLIAEPTSSDPHWSLGEALAHASRCERLHAGEFFGSGTLPGGSGIEIGQLLAAGDVIEIGIDRIASLTNRIVAHEESRA